jgi:hypothetical protein
LVGWAPGEKRKREAERRRGREIARQGEERKREV